MPSQTKTPSEKDELAIKRRKKATLEVEEGPVEAQNPLSLLQQLTASPGSMPRPEHVLRLQQSLGNRTTQRSLAPRIHRQEEGGTEEVEEETPEEGTAVLEVEETFEPEKAEEFPDKEIELTRVETGTEESSLETEEAVAAPVSQFTDRGREGTAAYGEIQDRQLDQFPHAFTDGGRTGTTLWGGGGGAGARGVQGVGSIQSQVAPNYQSSMNGAIAEAWVQAGTGTIDVTRSWIGIDAGDQTNGYYVTTAAAARINQHETLHVASTRGFYTTHLQPVLDRVYNYTPIPSGMGYKANAPTQPAAITALQTAIAWATGITNFQTADTNDNRPMGTVDTNDLGSGTYPVDAGPGKVGTTNFSHRIRTPSEPNPK